jgi:Metal-dependent hydrolases of the beta-lactamase superfamily II
MKITILVDDRAGRAGLQPEHGLALWIEADGRNILFDTGQGGVLENNARELGVELEKTESVVLSHGHYDHTGGWPGSCAALPAPRYTVTRRWYCPATACRPAWRAPSPCR